MLWYSNINFTDENTDSNNIAAIIGGCIGFVVILIFVLSGMIYYKMKAKQNGYVSIIKYVITYD